MYQWIFSILFWLRNFFVQKEAGIPKKIIKVEDIPGLSKFFDNPQMFDLRIFNIVLMECDYIW